MVGSVTEAAAATAAWPTGAGASGAGATGTTKKKLRLDETG